jgi:hypothetical protein
VEVVTSFAAAAPSRSGTGVVAAEPAWADADRVETWEALVAVVRAVSPPVARATTAPRHAKR